MRKFFVMTAALCVSAVLLCATVAKAEEAAENAKKENNLNIKFDDQMNAASKAYDEAVANLTAEQKDELEKLNSEFAGTMEPDIQILNRSAELEHCVANDEAFKAEAEKHTAAFIRWRDAMNADQDKLWAAHRTLRRKLTYLDQAMLDNYYVFQGKLMLQLIGGVAIIARDNGSFAKTDCAALAAALEAVSAGEGKNPENAPKTAE